MTRAIEATVEGTGEAIILAPFAADYQRLTAALDWARVFSAQHSTEATAIELEAAAAAARAIAAQCDQYTYTARSMPVRGPMASS